jgi:hypothetical protein
MSQIGRASPLCRIPSASRDTFAKRCPGSGSDSIQLSQKHVSTYFEAHEYSLSRVCSNCESKFKENQYDAVHLRVTKLGSPDIAFVGSGTNTDMPEKALNLSWRARDKGLFTARRSREHNYGSRVTIKISDRIHQVWRRSSSRSVLLE